jgi:hypothetical protein
MNVKLVLILGALLLLVGCANLIRVKEDGPSNNVSSATGRGTQGSGEAPEKTYPQVGGIPFYVKKQQFTQTSTYQQTWIRATLFAKRVSVDDKTGKQISEPDVPIIRNLARDKVSSLDPVRQAILNANPEDFAAGSRAIAAFQAVQEVELSDIKPVLVGNQLRPEVIVDYEKKYYVNAPLPWFGTGSLTQKLSGDGTLTEVTSSSDTKLAEGLSTLAPFKEFLSGEFVKSGTAAVEDADTKDVAMSLASQQQSANPGFRIATSRYKLVLTLKLEEVGYEYVLSRTPIPKPPGAVTAIPFAEMANGTAYFTRKAIGSEDTEGAKNDKDETRQIAISGSIVLPKEPDKPEEEESTNEKK